MKARIRKIIAKAHAKNKSSKKHAAKNTACVCIALFAFVYSGLSFPIYAQDKSLGTASGNYTIEMWHYSGGYWKIGNDLKTSVKIYDRDISSISGYLNAGDSIGLRIALPANVQNAIAQGKTVSIKLKGDMSQYADSNISWSLTEKTADVYFKPRFKVSSSASFDDFVSGLSVCIPLVDSACGSNIYAIYGNGKSGAGGDGWFSGSSPSKINSPYIHPSEIKDKSGNFKSGYKIMVAGIGVDSEGYSVGKGTFAGGGAVGLQFSFNLQLEFFECDSQEASSLDPNPEEGGTEDIPVVPPVNPILPPVDPPEDNSEIHRRH